jgi:hypothetical protein
MQAVLAVFQRHPTWSSYVVHQHYGAAAPSPRTIQRVRQRRGLARLPKRIPVTHPARRLPPETRQRAEAISSSH